MTQKQLNKIHKKLCKSYVDEDESKAWQKMLEELGCKYQLSYDWKGYGAVVNELIKVINKETDMIVLDDPSWEGSCGGVLLVFMPKKD